MSQKVFVIAGGGAAGIFCAVNAARMDPSLKVIVLEKSSKLLSKVRISGGGRCNVTHACFDIGEMSRRYPRGANFVKKSFHKFFVTDTIRWFEERGVMLKTEEDGRMFPVTDSSETIIDCLLKEVNRYGVDIRMNLSVVKIARGADGRFVLDLSNGSTITTDDFCLATGGYPKSGMFDWIRETGHLTDDPVPSLFTFNLPGHPLNKLMGITIEKVKVKVEGIPEQEGPLLMTHWGLSGPAVLRASAWGARELASKKWEFVARINFLPAYNEQTLSEKIKLLRAELSSSKIVTRSPFGLPLRFWQYLLGEVGIDESVRWSELKMKDQNKLVALLCNYTVHVKGKTTFKEEFVTAGGVSTLEIDPSTMMSRKMKGLYFAGEVMNVDGITGGYNFQHAWTSGWIAARSVAGSEV